MTRKESGFVHDLAPLTALGALAPQQEQIGPVTLAEAPDWALASVSARLGQEAACAAALAQALGAEAPGVARYHGGVGLGAFWIAPHSWMVQAPYSADLAGDLRGQLGPCASVTDQSSAWARCDVTGPAPLVAEMFARLCNLDLPHLPSGTARRTVIDHLGCYLLRGDGGAVSVYGPRSGAQSLWHALQLAARSVV
jgi:sarcosine oxidase, subunit gamma